MFISKILSQHGRDFTALIVCEHCATHAKLDTGYNDAYYHDHVLPAITCGTCGKNRAGVVPAQANDSGLCHVAAGDAS